MAHSCRPSLETVSPWLMLSHPEMVGDHTSLPLSTPTQPSTVITDCQQGSNSLAPLPGRTALLGFPEFTVGLIEKAHIFVRLFICLILHPSFPCSFHLRTFPH